MAPEPLWSRLAAEFVGTLFLCTAALSGNPVAPPAILLPMIFAYGHVSGAHFNPAVTLAFVVFEWPRFKASTAVLYVVVQLVAALGAAGLHELLVADALVAASAAAACGATCLLQNAVAELLGTFALVSVIMHVALLQPDNSFFGLAIAGTVLGAGLLFAPLSTTFNPAVLTALLVDGQAAVRAALYFVVQLIAAPVAAALAKAMCRQTRRALLKGRDDGCCSRIEEPLLESGSVNTTDNYSTM